MFESLTKFVLPSICVIMLMMAANVAAQQTSPPAQPSALPVVPPSEIAFRSLKELDTQIAPPAGSFPVDFSGQLFRPREAVAEGVPVPKTFWWEAPEIWWRPLYFDNVPLERYGQTPAPRLQPALSGAEFFLMLPIMPYKMAVDPPWSRKTNLGYYRPGSPTPCVGRRLPLQANALLTEAATWVALVFLLP
ncbi:MAG: hypothetical protein KatS3mg110_0139 [Pirellulaceae bacterium]|nr:MAG: hypothetical protein KatS3mg110_0139 [Pirellulaceae bacterium]